MTTFVRLAALVMILQPAIAFAWPTWNISEGPKGGFLTDVGTDCEDLSAEPMTYGMLYDVAGSGLPTQVSDIHDIWLAGGCVGCHNNTAMGGLRLDNPEFAGFFLVGQASFRDSTILRVDPGNSENSLLYAMLNCTAPASYPPMPPPVDGTTQRINRALRAMVYDWIAQGARGFDSEGNPISVVTFRDSMESDRLQRNLTAPPP